MYCEILCKTSILLFILQLDLQEANKKLANGAAKAGEETSALKMQLEEQKKQLEEQRRKLDEHKKGLDSKSRQLEEREKSIADADQKLKKRKEKLDQLEAHIQKARYRYFLYFELNTVK